MTTRTRFAPSPTGVLHLGSVRTALFNWLYAMHSGGQYFLRIEDTDRERSTPENVDAIFDGLTWLGINSDQTPVFQTERFSRYKEVIENWLEQGLAYHCDCSRARLDQLRADQMQRGEKTRYDGRCRKSPVERVAESTVVRFKNPADGEVLVEDHVRGRVVFQNAELDDLIIERSDGSPTYNFAVVVDDFDMKISHVIRGDDHLNNAPRQLNMFAALGVEAPSFAHLPMILGADGAKLSKRHGAVDIRDYRSMGYLPEAVLNYLVRLGWSHGDQEVFSIDEMIQYFDIADVNHSASSFNPEKLEWLNQQHIQKAPVEILGQRLRPFLEQVGADVSEGPDPEVVAEIYRERATTLLQMAESAKYCYVDFTEFDAKAAKKNLRPVVLEPLESLLEGFTEIEDWSPESINSLIHRVAESHSMSLGKIGQPLRVAVSGGAVSPPIDSTVYLVGKPRVLARLSMAIDYVRKRSESG